MILNSKLLCMLMATTFGANLAHSIPDDFVTKKSSRLKTVSAQRSFKNLKARKKIFRTKKTSKTIVVVNHPSLSAGVTQGWVNKQLKSYAKKTSLPKAADVAFLSALAGTTKTATRTFLENGINTTAYSLTTGGANSAVQVAQALVSTIMGLIDYNNTAADGVSTKGFNNLQVSQDQNGRLIFFLRKDTARESLY